MEGLLFSRQEVNMGIETALIIAAIAGIGMGAYQMSQKPPSPPEIPNIPPPVVPGASGALPTTPESIAAINAAQTAQLTQGRTARPTLLTGPRGILTPPPIGLKTLLGQ